MQKYIPQMVTDGNRTSDEYDYDADYLENGMTFFENLQKNNGFQKQNVIYYFARYSCICRADCSIMQVREPKHTAVMKTDGY